MNEYVAAAKDGARNEPEPVARALLALGGSKPEDAAAAAAAALGVEAASFYSDPGVEEAVLRYVGSSMGSRSSNHGHNGGPLSSGHGDGSSSVASASAAGGISSPGRRRRIHGLEPDYANWTKFLSDDIAEHQLSGTTPTAPFVYHPHLYDSTDSAPNSPSETHIGSHVDSNVGPQQGVHDVGAVAVPVSSRITGRDESSEPLAVVKAARVAASSGYTTSSSGGITKGRKRSAANVDPALASIDRDQSPKPPSKKRRSVNSSVSQTNHHPQTHPHPSHDHTPRQELAIDMKNGASDGKASAVTVGGIDSVALGTEAGGGFDATECKLLDEYMERYCTENNLNRQALCERVWANDRKKDMFWDDVAGVLPHRSRASVYKHVRRTYHVFEQRGKWGAHEDQQLSELVGEKGKSWKAIGLIMHRMPEDCRDRWRNYLKCGGQRNQNKWTADEEGALRHIIAGMEREDPGAPINWTLVSEHMGGTRSRIQCRYKWRKLAKRTETVA